MIEILHWISGKLFWFFSAYFPPSHSARKFIEEWLLNFYQWEIARDPDLPDAYSKAASLMANRGNYDQAIAYFVTALEKVHPDPAKINYFMGRQKANLGDFPGALECFKKFIRLAARARGVPPEMAECWCRLEDESNFNLHRFHGYLYLGNKCLESGMKDLAVEYLQNSITLEPLVSGAHKTLADIYYMDGRKIEAYKFTRSGHMLRLRWSHPHVRISTRSKNRVSQPDFMIIGKGKCGTTSLYSYLTQHPHILPASTKELRFFDELYDRGLDWYLEQFAPIANQPQLITGEASGGYIDSLCAAGRIKEHFPQTRFVVLLRNPVDRAISHYYMDVQESNQMGGLEETLLRGVGPSNDYQPLNTYVDRSIYIKMLRVWMSIFPREQFLILPSERLYAAPAEVTNEVFEFLGQVPFTADDYPVRNKGREVFTNVDLERTLRDFFQPHNRELEEFLGMRFGWNE